ncbi:MAG: selenocysteine-specific translation elongation factor [Alcaligenaceae bacterium]
MIVATAGHIDHGKSTLVKALSGTDTDRLPEEKARGISIDLGFAYLTLPDTPVIGFVDVPGHERFVRNMLAGVCGIDYVMLVVAADDGVMPQTIEHLNIVKLLGIQAGVAVLTKTDRVSADRVNEVREQVHALLQSVNLATLEIIACSTVAQLGVNDLRERLAQAARTTQRTDFEGRSFRFAIDRAFSIVGSGTVVTGTVFTHGVQLGERLTLTPGGQSVRVRGIHKNGVAVTDAQAGERCALNLVGISAQDCGRGDWVVATHLHAPTTRVDISLNVLNAETHALNHWTEVHLHLGTTEVVARVAIDRGGSIAPGATGYAQLVLSNPIACLSGDRLIIRDQTAQRTLGGGIVLDPFAPPRVRNKILRQAELAAFSHENPRLALSALLVCHAKTGADLDHFSRSFNVTENVFAQMLASEEALVIAKAPSYALLKTSIEQLGQAISTHLQHYHRAQPQAPGLSLKDLRQQCATAMKASVFVALVRYIATAQQIIVTGTMAALTTHQSSAHAADQQMWQKIQPTLAAMGPKGLTAADLAQAAGLKVLVVNDMLHRKVKQGELFRVSSERFYLRANMIHFAKLARELVLASPTQTFIAAQFRDRAGVNRTLAIEILDVLDRLGVTQRVGDARKLLKPLETVFAID